MAVMATLKRCPDCGEVFVADSPNAKYCACCHAKKVMPKSASGGGYQKPPLSKLAADVRKAEAAGKSYAYWRHDEEEKQRKAEEELRRQIAERQKRREQRKKAKEKEHGESTV